MLILPVVRVGNSRGIRLPKKILDVLGVPDKVSVDIKNGYLIVRAATTTRQGWDDPARWRNTKLTKEDTEWLDAQLVT